MSIRVIVGDVREKLAELPDESVHCVVTSPPYYNLRDYGTASWVGGDPACQHSVGGQVQDSKAPGAIMTGMRPGADASRCRLCGATRTDKQIGLEPTPTEFVAVMVEVFREIKRVLRSDGVLFLNLGDSYCSANSEGSYKLREDCSLKDLQNVALAVFGVRIDNQEKAGQGPLPKMLPSDDQGRTVCERPTVESAGIAQELRTASLRRDGTDADQEQADKSRCDQGAGRQVRVLRGDDPAVHDAGSHQRGRRGTSQESGSFDNPDLSRSEASGLSEGSLSDSLLQLQLRDRIMGLLSAREFTADEIPARLRSCFRSVGLKPKDLIGIPWRVAFALQADGWYLRQDIIWSKPNPMPESVTDRCTKAHEYLFLLSRSPRYYYDADAIREPQVEPDRVQVNNRTPEATFDQRKGWRCDGDERGYHPDGRNRRSVWTVATQPFKEAHFATFPPDLIEPCILAGCPKDCCAKCGAPVVRQTETSGNGTVKAASGAYGHGAGRNDGDRHPSGGWTTGETVTTGWRPSCACNAGLARGTVLDPFGGAGTTGLVADRLQRDAILIELNPAYAALATNRITDDGPLFAEVVA